MVHDEIPIGIGFYTVPDAARLLKIPAVNVRRWLGGYTYRHGDKPGVELPPLWGPQLPPDDGHLQLGFRDLIELRFVQAFKNIGLNLITIRNCLELARELVRDERPFSTRKFRTDGKTIFLESAKQSDEEQLLDLRRKQYILKRVIERSFKDLDFGDDDIVTRWRPFKGKSSIVIDPRRAFGQPVATRSGIPTIALAQAADAEGSAQRVARLFEVPLGVVRNAVAFEQSLQAA